MKRLSHSVNIIPVIAKADTMTVEERQEFKQRVSVRGPTVELRRTSADVHGVWKKNQHGRFFGKASAIVKGSSCCSCHVGTSGRLCGCFWVFLPQVRKELEMGGIEFYPQKEFDEDMEDKSDNDKIRVGSFAFFGSVSFCVHISFFSGCWGTFPAWCLSKPRRTTVTRFRPQEAMPFAVVGSDKEYQVNGKRVLGRKTPWGIVEGGLSGLFPSLSYHC